VTREERLWEGAPEAAAAGRPVAELERWLEARAGRRVACLGARVAGTAHVSSDPELEATARAALNSVRRRKDALELARMRTAESATAAGFAAVAPLIAPGRSERDPADRARGGLLPQRRRRVGLRHDRRRRA
jgi:Xaa-Pro aminopeptidase